MSEPFPRDERNRFRIVVVRDGEPHTIASTETAEGVGTALVTLAREGEFAGLRVGVLDTLGETGKKWIVHPWIQAHGRERTPLLSRFTSKVAEQSNGCWLWTGSLDKAGYGQFQTGWLRKKGSKVCIAAHRMAYILSEGPIQDGMFVLHTCDTPACVNPQHLRLGTQLDNIRDMDAKGRCVRATVHRRLFTDDQAQEILSSSESSGSLDRKYGVLSGSVARFRHRGGYRPIPRKEGA